MKLGKPCEEIYKRVGNAKGKNNLNSGLSQVFLERSVKKKTNTTSLL